MKTIQDAIDEGLRQQDEEKEQARQAEVKLQLLRTEAFAREKDRYRTQYRKDLTPLLVQVAGAVKSGKTSFAFSGSAAHAAAINELSGFMAIYREGEAHINSDEVMDHWETVTVTWS